MANLPKQLFFLRMSEASFLAAFLFQRYRKQIEVLPSSEALFPQVLYRFGSLTILFLSTEKPLFLSTW